MKTISLLLIIAVSQAIAASDISIKSDNVSLRNEVQIAIDRGLAWLQKAQSPDGTWSLPQYPALTALPLTAFMLEPSGKSRKTKPEFIQKGYATLIGSVQLDGGIYRKGLANYNTSISLVALVAAEEPKFAPVIRAANAFIVGQQAKNMTDQSLDGGIGYGTIGTGSGKPDLSNTVTALEAIHACKNTEASELQSDRKALNWQAAIEFIQRCQNLPETNGPSLAGINADDKGGFIYAPGISKAGETASTDGKKSLRSYGSMSYAGLLSYIFSDVKKDDSRVVAVVDWLRNHYTLKENPGMGADGLYYYYYMMVKALFAYGSPELLMADGRKVDWRKEMALNLINLQKADGSWANESGRWMEKDPTLTTCYAVLALEFIHNSL